MEAEVRGRALYDRDGAALGFSRWDAATSGSTLGVEACTVSRSSRVSPPNSAPRSNSACLSEAYASERADFHLVVYQVKGTGQRLSGAVQFTNDAIYQPIGYPAPTVLDNSGGFAIHAGGDFDGDGSSDLIVGAPGQQNPADSYVLLLPGAARAPD